MKKKTVDSEITAPAETSEITENSEIVSINTTDNAEEIIVTDNNNNDNNNDKKTTPVFTITQL